MELADLIGRAEKAKEYATVFDKLGGGTKAAGVTMLADAVAARHAEMTATAAGAVAAAVGDAIADSIQPVAAAAHATIAGAWQPATAALQDQLAAFQPAGAILRDQLAAFQPAIAQLADEHQAMGSAFASALAPSVEQWTKIASSMLPDLSTLALKYHDLGATVAAAVAGVAEIEGVDFDSFFARDLDHDKFMPSEVAPVADPGETVTAVEASIMRWVVALAIVYALSHAVRDEDVVAIAADYLTGLQFMAAVVVWAMRGRRPNS